MTGRRRRRRLCLREEAGEEGLDQPAYDVARGHVHEYDEGGLPQGERLDLGGHADDEEEAEDEADVADDETGLGPGTHQAVAWSWLNSHVRSSRLI